MRAFALATFSDMISQLAALSRRQERKWLHILSSTIRDRLDDGYGEFGRFRDGDRVGRQNASLSPALFFGSTLARSSKMDGVGVGMLNSGGGISAGWNSYTSPSTSFRFCPNAHALPSGGLFASSTLSPSTQLILSSDLCSPQFRRTFRNVVTRTLSSAPNAARKASSTTIEEQNLTGNLLPPKQKATSSSNPEATPPTALTKQSSSTETSASRAAAIAEANLTLADSIKAIPAQLGQLLKSASKAITNFLWKLPGVTWFYLTHPSDFRKKLVELVEVVKKEAHHYWMGTKLLAADLRTAQQLLGRTLQGTPLTRRERKQLLRTVTDVFRMVPMAIFVLVPFMEFALPFALRLFPNMLPSTFQDSLKAEENMKRELKSRIAMAEFFQETLQDLASEQKKRAEKIIEAATDAQSEECVATEKEAEETAASFIDFIDRAKNGEMFPPDVIIRYSKYFEDDLTLDNLPRMQLINLCRYMNIPPYGSDILLRFRLRHKMRSLWEDDQRILWEGINSLTKMELREACQERGMRSYGLSKESYKSALQQWLDLSVNKSVPISLLIMSRTFFLHDEMGSGAPTNADDTKSLAGLTDAITGMEKDVVNEVVLEMATSEEKSNDPEVIKIKLEVLEHQNERIEEEQREREEAAAKKKEMEKLKAMEEERAAAQTDTTTVSEGVASDAQTMVAASTESPIAAEDSKKIGASVSVDMPLKQPEEAAKSDESSATTTPKDDEDSEEEEGQGLSTEEMEAISQLVSPDPVSSEREKLEQIKAAILDDGEVLANQEDADTTKSHVLENTTAQIPTEQLATEQNPEGAELPTVETVSDFEAAKKIAEMDGVVVAEANATTKMEFNGEIKPENETVEAEAEEETEEMRADKPMTAQDIRLEKAIHRLKSRVTSMVGKIETQLSDVGGKISDKLHLLDKDMDGMISREELAAVLQTVFKRNLTTEEAEAIASDMDENEDGFMTVFELAQWIDNNKLEKLVAEGRDAEVEKIIAKKAAKLKEGGKVDASSDGLQTDLVESKTS